jgi:thiol-disulfide isomerase/thioredoxin
MTAVMYTCPTCKMQLQIPESVSPGAKFKCPRCIMVFEVASPTHAALNETVAYQAHSFVLPDRGAATPETLPDPRPVVSQAATISVALPNRSAARRALWWGGLAAVCLLLALGGIALANRLTDTATPGAAQETPAATHLLQLFAPVCCAKESAPKMVVLVRKDEGVPPIVPPVPVRPPVPLGVNIDEQAPEIDAEDVDGRRFKLSDFRGKVVYLDFWGDWCPFCARMYPYKRALVKRGADKPLAVLGVNRERHNDKMLVKRVLQREHIDWPTWWCPPNQGNDLVDEWAINGYPQIFVLDHKGVIRWRNAGALDAQGCADLDRLIDELVADCERETKTAPPR